MQGSGGEAIQVEKVPKCWRRHLVLKEFSDGKTFLNIPINNENIKLIRSAIGVATQSKKSNLIKGKNFGVTKFQRKSSVYFQLFEEELFTGCQIFKSTFYQRVRVSITLVTFSK